jgi:hypothetical protein
MKTYFHASVFSAVVTCVFMIQSAASLGQAGLITGTLALYMLIFLFILELSVFLLFVIRQTRCKRLAKLSSSVIREF